MTSHEMRNPLSAVIQCADSSVASLKLVSKTIGASELLPDGMKKVQEEVQSSLDSLQTIISCSLHQKRIVDDILTLSKLDANLILITPIRVNPSSVMADAVNMFKAECIKENIDLMDKEDPSLHSCCEHNFVLLDPSRQTQVC